MACCWHQHNELEEGSRQAPSAQCLISYQNLRILTHHRTYIVIRAQSSQKRAKRCQSSSTHAILIGFEWGQQTLKATWWQDWNSTHLSQLQFTFKDVRLSKVLIWLTQIASNGWFIHIALIIFWIFHLFSHSRNPILDSEWTWHHSHNLTISTANWDGNFSIQTPWFKNRPWIGIILDEASINQWNTRSPSLSHRAASVHQFTTSEQTSYANFKLYWTMVTFMFRKFTAQAQSYVEFGEKDLID